MAVTLLPDVYDPRHIDLWEPEPDLPEELRDLPAKKIDPHAAIKAVTKQVLAAHRPTTPVKAVAKQTTIAALPKAATPGEAVSQTEPAIQAVAHQALATDIAAPPPAPPGEAVAQHALTAAVAALPQAPVGAVAQTTLETASAENGYRTKVREHHWVKIDLAGTLRNTLSGVAVLMGIATLVFAVAFLAIYGGCMIIRDALVGPKDEKGSLIAAANDWAKSLKTEDEEDQNIAFWSLLNQLFYSTIGFSLLGGGFTELLGTTAAHALDYASTLGHTAMATCDKISAVFSKIIGWACILRGAALIAAALSQLSYLLPFRSDFRDQLGAHEHDTDKAFDFLEAAFERDEDAFKRRVGEKAYKAYKEWDGNPLTQNEILLQIDQGIHKQICEQYLRILIGIILVVGGGAATFFSGGLAPVLIGFAILAVSEGLWFTYDKTILFTGIVDRFYQAPRALSHVYKKQIKLGAATPSLTWEDLWAFLKA